MASFAEAVMALRLFFGVEPSVSLPAAIQQMNVQMGIAAEGPLPAQVEICGPL